jgi:pyrroloquinoline-quinone synthase
MTMRDRLDAAIGEHRLLEHPFYQAWRDGTLPVEALATYAAEYGAFIAAVDQGWASVGEHEHAAEERRHADLWSVFGRHFGAEVSSPRLAETAALVETSRRLFSDPATAWGALYAFESQQPGTSEEKLKGLVDHFGVDGDGPAAEYFRVHAADYHEADAIVDALEADPDAADSAVVACAEMSVALWDALSGVHEA